MKFNTSLLSITLTLLLSSQLSSAQKPWELGPFTRPTEQPVLQPSTLAHFYCPMREQERQWMSNHTFNPAAVVKDNRVHVLFRAEDGQGDDIGTYTSRIGHAWSQDGTQFSYSHQPVLYPDKSPDSPSFEWYGGTEDPRIAVSEEGRYYLYYTMWNKGNPTGTKESARIGVASSLDLKHWQKHGAIFNDDLKDSWHKSASVVHKLVDGKLVAAKIQDKYWMYWGEHGVHAATSSDLIHWQAVRNTDGSLKVLLPTRPKHFDSELAEVGPPAVLTKNGIILIYNGKNSDTDGDIEYPSSAYTAGQALFASNDPTVMIDRADKPFLVPELPYEQSGQYGQGTVFTEGLVWFNNQWMLYFGAADSYVGVAFSD